MENGKSTIIITRNHSEKSVVKVKHQLVVTFEKLKRLGKHQHQHTTRKCELHLHEKLEMLMYPDQEELSNKCSEIMSRSPHQRKYLLSNYDSKD